MSIMFTVAFLLLVGCGTETPEAFTDSHADAVCESHVRCGVLEEADFAECVDGVASVKVYSCSGEWDAAGARQCLDDIAAQDCEDIGIVAVESCLNLCTE
jgi:hypothetical protein